MKKILSGFIASFLVVALVACGNTTDATKTYRSYTSGASKLNPYSESEATASDLFEYVTDSLYEGDYDWNAAIAQGLATSKGDFTNAAQLPFNYMPSMATADPVDVNGDGTVWQITLRDDLKFQDGTPINAETFNYSWQQLLSPLQLNVRATNLYQASSLPLVNAENYVKQLSPKADEYGFTMYTVGTDVVARANSYFGKTAGGYEIYNVEVKYANLVGPDGEKAYVENWGSASYGLGGWVLETQKDEYFMTDADKKLYAPKAGWTLDGIAVPVATDQTTYYGARPAYAKEDGTIITNVDAAGVPVGGTTIALDPVLWSSVGFKVINDLTIQITLKTAKDAWYVKGQLSSAITGVVHPAKYEAGLNQAKTQTTYGTIDNPLSSYGPYILTEWQDGVVYVYDKNEANYKSAEYAIERIRLDVIKDQSIAVNEFKAGRLDNVAASGTYYEEFKDSPTLRLTPSSQFMRFAFNIAERPDGTTNPILKQVAFRNAFYYAIDRLEFVTEVRAPGHANQGFIGPVYVATEAGSVGYRESQAGKDVFADRSPETAGFNPQKAKTLFNEAYAAAVAAGDIKQGDKVSIEYTYYKVETNDKVANWVKSTVEAIFNNGESTPKFELILNGLSDDALDAAWDTFDFDMTFGGWQGIQFNPLSLIGQVYNSVSGAINMLEHGFDTGNAVLTVDLPNTKAALTEWVAAFEAKYPGNDGATPAQIAAYNRWVAVLAKFGVAQSGTIKETELVATFDEFFKFGSTEFYNVADVNYEGKTEDFERIVAAVENELLDQMIAIPLFTSVSATVYSANVVFPTDQYHAWMGFGGIKYMNIK